MHTQIGPIAHAKEAQVALRKLLPRLERADPQRSNAALKQQSSWIRLHTPPLHSVAQTGEAPLLREGRRPSAPPGRA